MISEEAQVPSAQAVRSFSGQRAPQPPSHKQSLNNLLQHIGSGRLSAPSYEWISIDLWALFMSVPKPRYSIPFSVCLPFVPVVLTGKGNSTEKTGDYRQHHNSEICQEPQPPRTKVNI